MGNTTAKPKAPVSVANQNKSAALQQTSSSIGYASGLRPDEIGRAPPAATATQPRSKVLPDFFAGRDSLERARECFRFERDTARYNRLNDTTPCSTACKHKFSQCRTGCSGAALYDADLFGSQKQEDCAVVGSARCRYARESATLARQLAARKQSLSKTRNGSMYDGAQKKTVGKSAVTRRPVASIGVEKSVSNANRNVSLSPETNVTRLALVEAQKLRELEANKLGNDDEQ